MTDTGLIKYDSMIRAIAVCHDIDEIKDIRDKALALEKYAQVAMNTDAEYQAREIRLRAELKTGELIPIEQAAGRLAKRGADKSNVGQGDIKTLEDYGISRDQSSRWQRLAKIPRQEVEAALADPNKKASTSGLIAKNDAVVPMDRDALWIWGRLRDFERCDIFSRDIDDLVDKMTDTMAADTRRLAPVVCDFLRAITGDSNGK